LHSLFNKHLTKDESEPLYGFIGSKDVIERTSQDIYLTERDLERQVNSLEPIIYVKNATEERTVAWAELLQKLVLMGVPYDQINQWLKTETFNLVPPIDIDKFSNYNEYFWIGQWLLDFPTLPYHELGIPTNEARAALIKTNPTAVPEYYVIQRGELDSTNAPVPPIAGTTGWSDWALCNLWVHRDEALAFQSKYNDDLRFSDLIGAKLPIIEYFKGLKLNTNLNALGEPIDSGGIVRVDMKKGPNQPPLFDLYTHDGQHAKLASAVFYYKESSSDVVDSRIGRRIVVDENADFVFSLGINLPGTTELLWFKEWNGEAFDLTTVWRGGAETAAQYVKYDTSGTLINHDMFVNYKNYYWVGTAAASADLPAYNPVGDAEYYVIEAGGTSGWSRDNKWVHVSRLNRNDLSLYVQAQKPIIEFNLALEAELRDTKVSLNQVPRFKLYSFDQDTDTFIQVPNDNNALNNDAHTMGCLLARLEDLGLTKDAIKASADLSAQLFAYEDEFYVQSFVNGYFTGTSGNTEYGFITREVGRSAVGDGQLSIEPTAADALPQVYQLTAKTSTTFSVRSSVLGDLPDLEVGVPYDTYGANFKLVAGNTAFKAGDVITIDVKSVLFERVQLYANVNGSYRTFTQPADILDKDVSSSKLINATPALRNGVWAVPEQLAWNPTNETRTDLKQGDLVYHFASIIGAQKDIIGSPNGRNNFRTLPNVDFGIGGTIKQFNGRFGLLIGLLLQEGVTPVSLLDFSRASYEQMLGQIREFVEQEFITKLVDGTVALPIDGQLNAATKAELIKYLEHNAVTTASDVINAVNNVYFDTTMPIKACTATLPYMGLAAPVKPHVRLDKEQNFTVLVHHDGHSTKLPAVGENVLKDAVLLKFKRQNGQETSGIVSGPTAPNRPFAKQLWLDLSSMTLYMYNVIDDHGSQPADADIGAFTYNRATGEVWRFNGEWVSLGADIVAQEQPWLKLDLNTVLLSAMLSIEDELYKHCPPMVLRGQANHTDAAFAGLMQKEFEAFTAQHGILNPYAITYDATNAFTWNYIGAPSSYLTSTPAAWHVIYSKVYGTSRPDLEPWISAGYATAEEFIDAAVSAGALTAAVEFTPALWPQIAEFVRSKLVAQGKPAVLSVDIASGALIAPYAFGHAEQLFTDIPPTPLARYNFGDLGPIELMWTRTCDYVASLAKVAYMLNPLKTVNDCWGDAIKIVNGYELSADIGRKQAPADIPLHGTVIADPNITVDFITVSNVVPDLYTRVVTIELVSATDKLVKVTNGDDVSFAKLDAIVTDLFTAVIKEPKTGINVGDTFIVTVDTDGNTTIACAPAVIRKLPGLSQLYVHQHRFLGADNQIVANTTWLQGWTTRLAYRVGTFVDTDTLKVQIEDLTIDDPSAYSVLLKETPYVAKADITALRVTLLQVGSTERVAGKSIPAKPYGGQRGDDWIFRIDGYYPNCTNIEWYQYNTNGEYQTFFALGGANTVDEWKHYNERTGLRKAKAPFIVTGLQNLVSFVFGYADRLADLGFVFNEVENPVLDDTTGRLLDWQLQVEQLIDQQFRGVAAGSAFLLNPFSKKLWFKTPFGFVANLAHPATTLGELTPALYDSRGKHMRSHMYRVFRDDDLTEIVFDEPLYAATILISSHEHIIMFAQYTGLSTLLYDPFLGQRVSRLFLSGERQAVPNGRVSYGGKYLVNGQMRRNMEASVQNILKMYEASNSQLNAPDVEYARALLGFETKDYWRDRNAPEQTEFRFWQGAVKGKGTNFAVNAFINSKSYRTASLDEFWAYKVAQYGDARLTQDVELKIEPNDCPTERTNFLFFEQDELSLIRTWKKLNGYDVPVYDIIPYDDWSLYLSEQAALMERFDPRGTVFIRPDDEARWFRYSDLNTMTFFPAEVIAEVQLTPTDTETIYHLTTIDGKPVHADCFEVVDLSAIQGSDLYDMLPYDTAPFEASVNQVYREIGDYIPGTNPPEYEKPKFKRVNSSSIQFNDPIFIDRPIKVVCYGPPLAKYSPTQLYSYQGQDVCVKSDMVWWDPARGVHHPQAHAIVDYELSRDPAKYNTTDRTAANGNSDGLRVWGRNEVGKVWWDTTNLSWIPYNDTKLFPSLQERLARWGGLADDAAINVYEWIEADVPPTKYGDKVNNGDVTGEVAVVENLSRDRTWVQRPIAWVKSDNPQLMLRTPLAIQGPRLTPVVTNGRGSLVVSGGPAPTLSKGAKIAAVHYANGQRDVDAIIKPFGLYVVTSDQTSLVAGSSTNFTTPAFVDMVYFTNPTIVIDKSLVTYIGDVAGAITFTYETDGTTQFVRATYAANNKSQRIAMDDTPAAAGTKFDIVFDQLGLKLTLTAVYGNTEAWSTLGITTVEQRKQLLAKAVGNAAHDVIMREGFDVIEQIVPIDNGTVLAYLPGTADEGTIGWMAWEDPVDLSSDNPAPFNKYAPIYGDWTPVGDKLADVVDAIKREQRAPMITRDGNKVLGFQSNWSAWELIKPTVREGCFFTTSNRSFITACNEMFTFPGIINDFMVYVNGCRLTAFTVTHNGATTMVIPAADRVKNGDFVRVVQPAHVPTADELKYDPTAIDADPTVLKTYKVNMPYSFFEDRNEYGRVIKTRYYYWVKNKESAVYGKNLSVKRVADLLREHDDLYCVPQILKFYNQLDGRPNRYGMLSVKNLARYVRKSSNYKLRIRGVASMRNDDNDMRLKNIHEEWMIIRPFQTTRIPKELWDRLTDTLCGETVFGQVLPYVPYAAYDERNPHAPTAGYGIGVGQLMTDPKNARQTVKATILNTRVTKYDETTGEIMPDPINFTGFDINKLDTYLGSSDAIRAFMGDLWRKAKPKQINELFFAVLEDTLAKTKELSGIFKTSFISLNEVRTVAVDPLGANQ
jgi:hypothetical protein